MVAVAWSVGNVNPGEVVFVDGLVNGQIETSYERVELAVGLRTACSDVGSFAPHVLTCRYAAHSLI